MKNHLDGSVIAANVQFIRQVHKGAILILEGQTDDKALAKFVNKKLCHVEISFGKRNAIKALRLLKKRGVPGVVALVDADFDRIDKVVNDLDNLNVTDYHDMDMTLFLSSALEHVLGEKANGAKLKQNCKGSVDTLVEMVLSSAEELSCCRYVSRKRRLMLNFNNLKFDFIGMQDISCNSDGLNARSRRHGTNRLPAPLGGFTAPMFLYSGIGYHARPSQPYSFGRIAMDEDRFNIALRKFLKVVGITSQREIERVVREGNVAGAELKLRMTLTAENAPLNHVVEETIDLR